MSELGSSHSTVLAEEANDAREVLHMRVLPDAQVGRTDAALGDDRGGFREHGGCPANGASAQVDEMPVVGKAVFAGVLAHRRNRDAVTKMNIANLECVEQIHGLWMISGGDAVQSTSSIGNSPTFWKGILMISTFHWTQLDVTLFSNAEASKDPVENVVARGCPRDLVKRPQGAVKIEQQHLVRRLDADGAGRRVQRTQRVVD